MLPIRDRVGQGAMAMKRGSAFPKLQHYLNLTIRLFSVISRTLIGGGVIPLCRGVGIHQLYVGVFVGFEAWRSGAKGKAVLPLDIWLHSLVILYFTSHCLVGVMPCPKKVSKRIIQKEKTEQIRDEDVSFILSFIYWVQQPFRGWGSFSWIHWNDWIPQLRCQKYINSFHVCICPHLDISGFHKG